jgi:pyruvate kinase
MKDPVKIICTIGPASLNKEVMGRFKANGVEMVRINLSHVPATEIEDYITFLKGFEIPIVIDTEGAQVRTGVIGEEPLFLTIDSLVSLHRGQISCDAQNFYLTPFGVVDHLTVGDLISVDFNSVLLRVDDVSERDSRGLIRCRVVVQGLVGNNKGVHCHNLNERLPAFTEKDIRAVELAKKHGIARFTLSFMNSEKDVKRFKEMYPEAFGYAKIETLLGARNIAQILGTAHGILIDRGDLGRDIPIQKMPLVQKILIRAAIEANKQVFVASNLLETMADGLKPSRAEANDIVTTVMDGVSGFVLTKETAVGKYPVETVNMLATLIRNGQLALAYSVRGGGDTVSLRLSDLAQTGYISDSDPEGLLVRPHGGQLIERYATDEEKNRIDWDRISRIEADDNTLLDLDQIAIGTYSPIEGFLCRDDFYEVLNRMRLTNGIPWTIPIILTVDKDQRRKLEIGETALIISRGNKEARGIMRVEDIYPYDREEFAQNIYGTTDSRHPGVQMAKMLGDYIVGGRIGLLARQKNAYSQYNLTPRQVRSVFEGLGWSRVVGFHTRNVIHRSHEFIQLRALEKVGGDGLFVQPIIGSKKSGDFAAEMIIKSYEIMLEKYYPRNKVVFGLFATYSRYAGPRESIFTALCRKNFGCSHFIVGRDHTGVGDFYPPTASQTIFDRFDDLGISPVFFGEVSYHDDISEYVEDNGSSPPGSLSISGTQARGMLKENVLPPEWFMRREISDLIIDRLMKGENVFV